jgi:hypothetical protein
VRRRKHDERPGLTNPLFLIWICFQDCMSNQIDTGWIPSITARHNPTFIYICYVSSFRIQQTSSVLLLDSYFYPSYSSTFFLLINRLYSHLYISIYISSSSVTMRIGKPLRYVQAYFVDLMLSSGSSSEYKGHPQLQVITQAHNAIPLFRNTSVSSLFSQYVFFFFLHSVRLH